MDKKTRVRATKTALKNSKKMKSGKGAAIKAKGKGAKKKVTRKPSKRPAKEVSA